MDDPKEFGLMARGQDGITGSFRDMCLIPRLPIVSPLGRHGILEHLDVEENVLSRRDWVERFLICYTRPRTTENGKNQNCRTKRLKIVIGAGETNVFKV